MTSFPWKMGITVLIVTLTLGFAGCDTPSPLSHLPSVIMYSVENETRVYVSGNNHLYEGINITINGTSSVQNHTYGMTAGTNLSSFSLDIHVLTVDRSGREEKQLWYMYDATVWVEPRDDSRIFHITDTHHDHEVERTSPYVIRMEKMK